MNTYRKYSSPKIKIVQLHDLVEAQLAAIRSTSLPEGTRPLILADVQQACAALIRRRFTSNYIGKWTARGVASSLEGGEGDVATSPSQIKSPRKRSAQGDVDFRGSNPLLPHDGKAASTTATDPLTEGMP
jgi:hypothetical protein